MEDNVAESKDFNSILTSRSKYQPEHYFTIHQIMPMQNTQFSLHVHSATLLHRLQNMNTISSSFIIFSKSMLHWNT
eukprot:7628918-Ditylum_brightwellii.AAC.1